MYDLTNEDSINYLPAGIHTGLKLIKISKEPSKKDGTGQTVLRFTFEKEEESDGIKNKYYYVFTAFPINPDMIIERNQNNPNSKYADAKAVENEAKWFSNKIKHILGTFIPKEKLIFKITEKDPEKAWDMFCDKVIEIAGTAYEAYHFDIKLVLDANDRPRFPKYSFQPFIKSSTNAVVKLSIDPKYERITPNPQDDVKGEEWGTTKEDDGKSDDLPF